MKFSATASAHGKSPVRSSVSHPSSAPGSPQPPALLDARSRSDRFRCGGRKGLRRRPETKRLSAILTTASLYVILALILHTFTTSVSGASVNPNGNLQFSSSVFSVDESAGVATITVTRVGGSTGEVAVNYVAIARSAISGVDFTAASGILTFADGETSKSFPVQILDDLQIESTKTVKLALSRPIGGAQLGKLFTAVLAILPSDSGQYLLDVPLAPIFFDGTFPIAVTTKGVVLDGTLNVTTNFAGKVAGSLDLGGQTFVVTGKALALLSHISIALTAVSGSNKLSLVGNLKISRHAPKITGIKKGAGQVSPGTGRFTLDLSAAPPLLAHIELSLGAGASGKLSGNGSCTVGDQRISVTASGATGKGITLSIKGSGFLFSGKGVSRQDGGYLLTFKATGFGSRRSGKSIALVKVLESVSQNITAAQGGTITLPGGASVTIPALLLSSDQAVTLSLLSSLPRQPSSTIIIGVGQSLALTFSPIQPTQLSPSFIKAQTAVDSGSVSFVIPYIGGAPDGITGSVPMADVVDLRGANGFIGIPGGYDAATNTTSLIVPSQFVPDSHRIYASAANLNPAVVSFLPPPRFGGRIWNPSIGKWLSMDGFDPSKKTLVLVHGILSNVEDSYGDCISEIMQKGGYKQVIGYDYNWTQHPSDSGQQFADFINGLGLTNVDIEAHSFGTLTTLAALASIRAHVSHVVLQGGPLDGTPLVEHENFDLLLFTLGEMKQGASWLAGYSNISDALHKMKTNGVLSDVAPGSTYLAGLRFAAVTGHPETQFIKIVGEKALLPPDYALAKAVTSYVFGGEKNDGLIPRSGADSSGIPGTTHYYDLNHTQLECDDSTILDVANEVNPPITITDVSAAEGDSGSKDFVFTVSIASPSFYPISVKYFTSNGSASAGSDYVRIPSATLTLNPGETSKTITVHVNSDLIPEANETFFVNLSNPVNAPIGKMHGVGTIINDDPRVFTADVGRSGELLGTVTGCGLSTSLYLGGLIHFEVRDSGAGGISTGTITGYVDSPDYSTVFYEWTGDLTWNGDTLSGNLERTDNPSRPSVTLTVIRQPSGKYILNAIMPFTYLLYLLDGSCTGGLHTFNYQASGVIMHPQ